MLLKETVTLFSPTGNRLGVSAGRIVLPPSCKTIKAIGIFPLYENPISSIVSCSINDKDCIFENAIIDSGTSDFNNIKELMHEVNKPVSLKSFIRVALMSLSAISHTNSYEYKVNVYIEWN